jgi:hypothetical protein
VGPVSTCVRELTSRVMAADRPYGEFYDFYSVSSEYFVDTPSYAMAVSFCIHIQSFPQKPYSGLETMRPSVVSFNFEFLTSKVEHIPLQVISLCLQQ